IVALLCCLLALDNGFQACIMAPTEILAEQHFATIRELLSPLPVTVELLTGSVKGKARKEIMQGIADGTVHILVGTHALIEPTVRFLNLGFVVIDEQHRFGVKQRAALWEKNVRPPHVLVMTATPIPRTLAMTVYGDLDVSVIDALPPGRKPIQTIHYTQKERGYMYTGMMRELAAGRQVYVVFPLIEGSEESNLQDLETGYNNLCDVFPTFKIGKVHGRMKPADKDAVMQAFKRRELNILVATTVIEVGVNVPNASVMVIENADRFGLSQLHQLRGRVGRGSDKAYCILMTDSKLTDSARRRMAVMVESTDGFVIAEEDMRLRGPGDMDGTQQSGMPFDLKIANLVRDTDLMAAARDTAAALLEQDPEERLPQNAVAWQQLKLFKKSQQSFSEIS
ncbi:MAG: ATP-dependent DNA helicase RecG, partial [Bacteroidales bacterium]